MTSRRLERIYVSLISAESLPDIRLLLEDPEAYIQTDITQVNAITQRCTQGGTGLPLGSSGQRSLFPRLHAFAVACVQSQPQKLQGNTRGMEETTSALAQGHLERLARFMVPQTNLGSVIREATCTGLHPFDNWEEEILKLDLRFVAAMLLQHLADGPSRDAFLKKKTESVDQGLQDLLQLLLEQPDLNIVHDKLLRSQLKLAKHTGLYPSSLQHNTIDNCTASPVAIGGFGDVYKARLGDQDVAVKVMRGTVAGGISQHSLVKCFAQEVVLWSHVSHLNILPFYGVYVASGEQHGTPPRVSLLSPWMENGNIIEYTMANPHIERGALVLDIVRGLDYLHSFNPSIVHGDLKGDNILVSPSGRACIADFGLGRLVQDKVWLTSAASTLFGAHLYLAPELLDDQPTDIGYTAKRSPSTDVYAFGCVCYELYAGHARFSDLPSPMRRIRAIMGNQPCPKPEGIGDSLWDMVQLCWGLDPKKRPLTADFYLPLKGRPIAAKCGAGPYPWEGAIMSRIVPKPNQEPPKERYATASIQPAIPRSPATILRAPTPIEGLESRLKPRGIKLPGWKTAGLASSDVILLVLGAPLCGKTTFVKKYFADPALPVGPIHHQLLPPSHPVTAYLASGRDTPDSTHGFVLLIDTPSLFSWKSDDLAILKETIEILEHNRSRHTRILYLHDMSSPRMTIDITMSLAILKAICGEQSYPKVWLATTHWGRDPTSSPHGYDERETHLKTVYWKELLDGGAQYRRMHGALTEQAIVDNIVNSVALDSSEMTPEFKVLQELSQGKRSLLRTELWGVLKGCLGMLLEEEAKSGGDKERRDFLKQKYREMTRK